MYHLAFTRFTVLFPATLALVLALMLVFGSRSQAQGGGESSRIAATGHMTSGKFSPDLPPVVLFNEATAAGDLKEPGKDAVPSSSATSPRDCPCGAGWAGQSGNLRLRYEDMVAYVPIRNLAQSIARTLERAAPEKRAAMLEKIPTGLRLLVLWELSSETKARLLVEWHERAQRRFPEKAPAILSSVKKHLAHLPLLEDSLKAGIIDFTEGDRFSSTLTTAEKEVSSLITARFVGKCLPLSHPGQVWIGPDGIRFLETFARAFSIPPSFIEAARSASPRTLSSNTESDGFFMFSPDASGPATRLSQAICNCSGDHMCEKAICDTTPNGCEPQPGCLQVHTPILCTGRCKSSQGVMPIDSMW